MLQVHYVDKDSHEVILHSSWSEDPAWGHPEGYGVKADLTVEALMELGHFAWIVRVADDSDIA